MLYGNSGMGARKIVLVLVYPAIMAGLNDMGSPVGVLSQERKFELGVQRKLR